ncbi:MAG: pilus assembly protein HicB [Chthoniobacteraceae bacterium]
MKPADRYHRFVRWSDEDHAYVGFCPDLYFGGVCHGDSEEAVYADLCAIVRDEIAHRTAKGESLPEPRVRAMAEV